jgi:serine/threonine-protein kinase RsbW
LAAPVLQLLCDHQPRPLEFVVLRVYQLESTNSDPCIANNELNMPASDSPEQPLPEKDFDPDKLHLLLRVTLSADRKAVDPVVQEVMAVVREMKGVNGKEDAIELALQEALANAVIHGAKEDPTKTVECLVSSDEERGVLIVVRDPGTGFTPEVIPSCTVGENVYSNHGRGIFLINQLMDKVEFRKNGTEIHMVKR